MTAVWVVAGIIVVVGLMDLWVRLVYHYPRRPHTTTPAAFGIPFSEVRFPTRRNRHLYGWWIPAPQEASDPLPTLILVHGWGRNVERTMPYVQHLHRLGYDLLAFDARNHGSSDPDRYPNLLMFSEDIRAAVDVVVQCTAGTPGPIGVVGLSVGGGAAIHAAAHDHRITSVVTVGAMAHPVDVMRPEFQKRHVPYFPVVWLTLEYLQLRIGARFDRFAPGNVIEKARARMLLVHGEADVVVPVEQARKLLQAGNPETVRLWTIPGWGHSDCHEEPDFWQQIDAFVREDVPSRRA
jgi:pimeloyl-ACP methyl ester carboxylesterase